VELFAEQGYEKTTVLQIANASGYSGGLVSHRFGSKLNLLVAVIHWVASNLFEARLLPAATTSTATEAIQNYVQVCLSELDVHPTRVRAMYVLVAEGLTSEPDVREEIATLNRNFRSVFEKLVRRGIDEGEFEPTADTEDVASIIVGLLRGVILMHLIDADGYDAKHLEPLITQSIPRLLPYKVEN